MRQHAHRLDAFIRKSAAGLLEAVRLTLQVFHAPDKERWTTGALLYRLRAAEAFVRDVLRELAQDMFVYPLIVCERKTGQTAPPEPSQDRAPYFRLGVSPLSRESDEHKQGAGADAPSQATPGEDTASRITEKSSPSFAQLAEGRPPKKLADNDALHISSLARRLSALDDVLAHPGKHTARMARALYRAEHGAGGWLAARSEDELMLDHMNAVMEDCAYADSEAARLTHKMLGLGKDPQPAPYLNSS